MKKFPGSVLIIDDDEHVVVTSRIILKDYFDKIETLDSPKNLEIKLKQQDFDVVLLDMNFKKGATGGAEGIFWLNRIQEISPRSQVILQTAYGDIDLAVRSIKGGATDFLPKPWDKDKLVTATTNAYHQSIAKKNSALNQAPPASQDRPDAPPFIASADSMQPVLHAISQVAKTNAAVLILGENGTGKELVARSIHKQSQRAHGPFVPVDVSALPATLFETEMFGHGGKFELANGGTLFLNEVGNLAPELQVKLLSALQSKTIVRVICATNAPIYELVKEGSFRQDLFYRIKTVEIPLPPLRDRKEDIPALVSHYLKMYNQHYHKTAEIPVSTMDKLTAYHWPGNIRQLRHAVERAVILSREEKLGIQDFQLTDQRYSNTFSSLNLADVEREAIRKAISKHRSNMTKAAEELGIGRTTLYRKIEEYGISSH